MRLNKGSFSRFVVLALTAALSASSSLASSTTPSLQILRSKVLARNAGCVTSRVRGATLDPVTSKVRPFEWTRFEPQGKAIVGTVFIFPKGSGEGLPERSFARFFCDVGIVAISLREEETFASDASLVEDPADWESENHTLRRAYVATEALIGTNQAPYGVMGLSGGGISASLLMAKEPRIAAGATIASGAPFADDLTLTNLGEKVKIRDERMRRAGLRTLDQYHQRLSELFTWDPGKLLPGRFGKKPAFVVIAGSDKQMPTSTQEALARYFANPTIERQEHSNHLMAIAESPWLYRNKLPEFFLKAFRRSR